MSSLFKTPKIPKPPPPTPMPDPEDVQARQAKRAQMETMRQRGGRESTILSAGEPAGGDYAKKSLG
jgi:hypothetical protein